MSLFKIFDVAGSGMSAQMLRLNTVASNLANADSVSSSLNETYRARQPVFSALMGQFSDDPSVGVEMRGVVESQAPLRREHAPDHPMADDDGYIYRSNVNTMEEMANMIAASRAYSNNIEVLNTSKKLLMNTLRLGQ